MLSECAKYGIPVETRGTDGRDAPSWEDSSALEYGHDNLAKSIKELIKVREAVAMGAFRPDTARSGILAPGARR